MVIGSPPVGAIAGCLQMSIGKDWMSGGYNIGRSVAFSGAVSRLTGVVYWWWW